MTADPEAEAIARRLSAAQKRALLWLPADGSQTTGRLDRAVSGACGSLALTTRCADGRWDMGFPGKRAAVLRYNLTATGLRVRAILAAEVSDG